MILSKNTDAKVMFTSLHFVDKCRASYIVRAFIHKHSVRKLAFPLLVV